MSPIHINICWYKTKKVIITVLTIEYLVEFSVELLLSQVSKIWLCYVKHKKNHEYEELFNH